MENVCVVDYWAAEVLELASNAARDRQTPYYSDAFTTRHFRNEQIVVRCYDSTRLCITKYFGISVNKEIRKETLASY